MEPEDETTPPTRRETLVPAMAVTAVAVVAVAAAFMARRADTEPQAPVQAAAAPAAARPSPTQRTEVVTAPPLKPALDSMGGPAACRTCGTVQMVVAVYDRSRKQPRGYEMHIRMDDGSVRTVEQRGALAAGSRVVLEGSTVKPMS